MGVDGAPSPGSPNWNKFGRIALFINSMFDVSVLFKLKFSDNDINKLLLLSGWDTIVPVRIK